MTDSDGEPSPPHAMLRHTNYEASCKEEVASKQSVLLQGLSQPRGQRWTTQLLQSTAGYKTASWANAAGHQGNISAQARA